MPARTRYQDDRKAVRQGKTEVVPVSISRISNYATCPASYKFQYIDRVPRTTGDAAQAGTAFHDYVHELMSGNTEAKLDFPLKSFADYARMKKLAEDLAAEKSNVAALEETLAWREEIAGKVVEFEARIDKLQILDDDSAIVTDYKTGYVIPTDLTADPQGLTYALAVVQHYPATWQVVFRQAQVRHGRTLEVTFSSEKIQSWKETLYNKVAVMIQDEEFTPTPGDYCRLCAYAVGHCVVGQKLMGRQKALTSPESAREAGEALAYLDGVSMHLRNALKGYVAENGPVKLTSGDSWEYRERKRVVIPKDRIDDARAILDEYGHNPDDYIETKVNYVSTRKWLQGRNAIAELRELAEEIPYTSFDLSKEKG